MPPDPKKDVVQFFLLLSSNYQTENNVVLLIVLILCNIIAINKSTAIRRVHEWMGPADVKT